MFKSPARRMAPATSTSRASAPQASAPQAFASVWRSAVPCLALAVLLIIGAPAASGQGEGSLDSGGPAPLSPGQTLATVRTDPRNFQSSEPNGGVPADLGKRVRVVQLLNNQIPLQLHFKDENGKDVQLSQYFNEDKPVLLNMMQLTCDQVCSAELNVMTSSLLEVPFDAGKQYTVLTVSIDPRETPLIAKDVQDERMKEYTRAGGREGWHFLTGKQRDIRALANAVGFKYIWDEPTKQFIHPDGLIVLTPEGQISRYFLQLDYKPQDIRFSLMEASKGQIGSVIDRLAISCFHYDEQKHKYTFAIMRFLQYVSVAFVAGCLLTICAWVAAEKARGLRGRTVRPGPLKSA